MLTPKSGLFLAIACVAAIAAVGCVFELTSGEPELGTVTTGTILGLSIPVTIASFFGAIKNAQQD
ncbi:MAG: hypothetical protein VKL01_08810 [Limnothrix sp.]|jgi:hypothetical protein|uniref:Lipoprotein n=1 Tax=Limnothrix redekei LRLZ20PSL1 TaxID=3112953 RepID=A0ABW7CCM1_9CYAN|nr:MULTISPECIES: hypothetical protein [unclassified Limnothrix]MEB3118453.1 hypothetical protein [Limnothrix sp.]RFP52053.1 MAG: hypothetical protein BJG00_018920 [Limnothrix sp. CACIAM 69d]MBD2161163.1 hypothetical protein [Limnothrix sp. FACHB-1083]MBD2192474.1 hypothetical protein [Limnothrix sp. FACHB-1088]MBD2553288.1 hypothetical protein [Limnothrix sp. FACHB-708]